MITRPLAVLMAVCAVAAAKASPTVTWNNAVWTSTSVTYSGTVETVNAGGDSVALTFDKFNSDTVATALEQPGTYTLTSVVLSIDGTIAGTFSYQNTQANSAKVYSSGLNSSTTRFSLSANGKSANEYYSYTVLTDSDTPITVAGNTTETRNLPTLSTARYRHNHDFRRLGEFHCSRAQHGGVAWPRLYRAAGPSQIRPLSGLTASRCL